MKCENCEQEHDGTYGSGRFCGCKCARGFSTKHNRSEISKKVSKTLTRENTLVDRTCGYCGKNYKARKNRSLFYCSHSCNAKSRWCDVEYRERMTKLIKDRCRDESERLRLRDIGRKGGFGKKGYTSNGVYYESMFEKACFEHLEVNNIKFTPHKPIPDSSKVSDVYLDDLDMWVELDGIDREKRQKWLGLDYDYWLEKLKIYETQGLKLVVVKHLNELIEMLDKNGSQV